MNYSDVQSHKLPIAQFYTRQEYAWHGADSAADGAQDGMPPSWSYVDRLRKQSASATGCVKRFSYTRAVL